MIENEKFEPLTLWNDTELRYRIVVILYLISIPFQTVNGSNFPFPIIVIVSDIASKFTHDFCNQKLRKKMSNQTEINFIN